jgi:phosphatidylserine/phosphatidylglycerophosphate/cardiolipin synthase-like enzyme
VHAVFFVNVEQPTAVHDDEDAYGCAQLDLFLSENWPFGPPFPTLHCDRRALRPGRGREYCSLHAKCVSVDGERSFLSSANFTMRGHERNIEVGVLLHDATFASQLERQWLSLIDDGLVYSRARVG